MTAHHTTSLMAGLLCSFSLFSFDTLAASATEDEPLVHAVVASSCQAHMASSVLPATCLHPPTSRRALSATILFDLVRNSSIRIPTNLRPVLLVEALLRSERGAGLPDISAELLDQPSEVRLTLSTLAQWISSSESAPGGLLRALNCFDDLAKDPIRVQACAAASNWAATSGTSPWATAHDYEASNQRILHVLEATEGLGPVKPLVHYAFGGAGVAGLVDHLSPRMVNWRLDADIAALSVTSRSRDIGGGLLIGYQGASAGVVASGSMRTYRLGGASFVAQRRLDGSLAAWKKLSVGDSIWLDLSGDVQISSFEADAATEGNDLAGGSSRERTFAFRGSALAGLHVATGRTFAGELAAGGGGRYESHSASISTTFASYAPAQVNTTVSGLLKGRLRWEIWPEALSLRYRGEGHLFRTRIGSSSSFSFAGLGASVATSVARLAVESSHRGCLDMLFLKVPLVDIVPYVEGGVEVLYVSGDLDHQAAFVPVVGVGLQRGDW